MTSHEVMRADAELFRRVGPARAMGDLHADALADKLAGHLLQLLDEYGETARQLRLIRQRVAFAASSLELPPCRPRRPRMQ